MKRVRGTKFYKHRAESEFTGCLGTECSERNSPKQDPFSLWLGELDKPRERPNALGQKEQQAQSIQGPRVQSNRRPGNPASQSGLPVVPLPWPRACAHSVAAVVSDSLRSLDCGPPGSSVHGILQARILKWLAFPSPGDLSSPGLEPPSLSSPVPQADSVLLSRRGSLYPDHALPSSHPHTLEGGEAPGVFR